MQTDDRRRIVGIHFRFLGYRYLANILKILAAPYFNIGGAIVSAHKTLCDRLACTGNAGTDNNFFLL